MEEALGREVGERRWLQAESNRARNQGWRQWLASAVRLFKLRIVALLVFASVAGAFLGASAAPRAGQMLVLVIAGGSAAAGASALNQYLERERDRAMRRTRNRPLAQGRLGNPVWVLWLSLSMILLPALLVAPGNAAFAFFLVLGAFIYAAVYTLWLKPRSSLNIVIGGAAGSAAVMSGGAAVGGWTEPGVIVLALLVFLWTPAHFWALSLLYRDDYQRGEFPMLTAQLPGERARWWILVHGAATVLAGLGLAVLPELGWLYVAPVLVVSAWFINTMLGLMREPVPDSASTVFLASNLYLLVLLAGITLAKARDFLVA